MKLSKRIMGIQPSATFAVDAKAKELSGQGKNVISFGAGEPDFVSPPAAFEYARKALDLGETHYTPTPSIPELRQEICTYYKKQFDIDYAPAQVIVGSGAKPCIYEALAGIIDPGDEVIMLSPTWVSYVEQVNFLEGKVTVVDTTDTGFIPLPERVEKVITDKTAAILLNSPSNPTGVILSEETIRQMGQLALQYDIWLIWDEIYERLVYGDAKHLNPVQIMPELKDNAIIINGVSKAYAMTGWRIGYVLAPLKLASKINALQGHLTSNPCSIAQWAAVGALRESDDDVEQMRGSFGLRRDLICSLLHNMPLITFPEPQGAFYVFVDVSACIGKKYRDQIIHDDLSFCSALLEGELVAVVPGSAFLAPNYIRLSYACSSEIIAEGMRRLSNFLHELA